MIRASLLALALTAAVAPLHAQQATPAKKLYCWNEGGRKVEAEHYEWYANQGVVLKVKYRPRSVRRGGS